MARYWPPAVQDMLAGLPEPERIDLISLVGESAGPGPDEPDT